jgi:hypothetical protein
MSIKIVHIREVESKRNATSSEGRKANAAYRTREHLTEAEMARKRRARKCNRFGSCAVSKTETPPTSQVTLLSIKQT